jgi:hypothetical protein
MKFHDVIGHKNTMGMPDVFGNHEFHHEKRALCPHLSYSLPMSQDPAKAAKARALVASLLFVEAGVVFALAGWLLVLTITSDSFELLPLLGVLLFAFLGGGGLLLCGLFYKSGKYYGRAPAVLANLIALGVVSYQIEAHLWFVAIPLAALAGTTLISVLRAIPTDL